MHPRISVPAHARIADGGANAAEILRIGVGGRGPAMGEAMVAGAKGVDALRYNPAGLGWTDRREGGLSYHDIVLDVGMGSLSYASPWRRHGRSDGWAAGITYIDYGSEKRTTVADQVGSGGSTFGGNDFVLSGAYGTKIREALGVGGAARMISSSIDNANATAFSMDLGLQWRPNALGERLMVGAAVQNFGSSLKYFSAKEELPLTIRGGLSYEIQPGRWIANADLEKTSEENVTLHLGTEYRVTDALALRAGYDGANRSGRGITAGLGLRQGNFALDYAYVPFGEFGNTHRLALLYDMGIVEHGQPALIEPIPALLEVEARDAEPAPVPAPFLVPEPVVAPESVAAPVSRSDPAPAPVPSPAPDPAPVPAPKPVPVSEAYSTIKPVVPAANIEVEPTFPDGIVGSLMRQGYHATNAGNLKDAASFYGAVLAFDATNTRAIYNCATIHYRMAHYDDARHYYERLLELAPDDAEAWLYLGNSLDKLGERDRAITVWKKATVLNPSDPAAAKALSEGQRR